ncbi:uncharacterized protein LOC120110168 [Phoenix dactylifera]|uniref:Uncharacterized protein LOC120110168 n=1 Tax=Phoenix dactylifera TaxID=42345 RepID=A0A8B9A105_PHODC|nr:uncharacterized protein LOC120110168 [Phoenix dactylifera]
MFIPGIRFKPWGTYSFLALTSLSSLRLSLSLHFLCLLGMGSFQAWVSEHKLAGVGTLWAAALVASLAYSRKRSPHKTSIRLIHARMHAQALTLAVLSGAALKHYYETKFAVDDNKN